MTDQPTATPLPTRRTWLVLMLVVLVGAVAAWLGWREPEARWPLRPTMASASGQTLPAASHPRVPSAPAKAQARPVGFGGDTASPTTQGWPLWEFQLKQPLPPRDPPLTPPNWRLIGAAHDGKNWQLIVMRQGNPQPVFFKVGESLPGGFLIELITEEEVTLKHRQRRLVLSYIG